MSKRTDFTQQKWGRLTYIGEAGHAIYIRPCGKPRRERLCNFACDCGNTVTLHAANVATANTKSCGCFRVEFSAAIKKSHGKAGTDLYRIYRHMINRCNNPKVERYGLYGGRGITVCNEWRGPGGFEAWLAHIGPRPSLNHSIDRIDNDGNYEPGNVRWADRLTQARNRSVTLKCKLDGNEVTVKQAAAILGVKYSTVWNWLATGRIGDPRLSVI